MRRLYRAGLLSSIAIAAFTFSACGGEYACPVSCVAPTVVITEGESVTYEVLRLNKPKQRMEVSKSNNTIRVKSDNNQDIKLNYTVPDCSCGTYEVEKNKTLSPIESYLVGKAYQFEIGLIELLIKNGANDLTQQKDLTITSSEETEAPNANVLGYTFDTMLTSKKTVSYGKTVYVLETKQVISNNGAIPNDGLTFAKVTNQATNEVLLEIALTQWNGV